MNEEKNYKINIDWKVVDDLLVAGCPGTEVAAYIGCHSDTLYRRIEEKYHTTYTAYLQEKRSKGDALIRAQQFAKAVGLSKKGDNMMLIWLGKNKLGQKETQENNVAPNDKSLDGLISELKSLKDTINAAKPEADSKL